MKKSKILFTLLLIFIALNGSSCSNITAATITSWAWLGENGGTYWYVPTPYLPAVVWNTSDPSAWTFNMQMASGSSTEMVAHWAYMYQCTENKECWTNLPGSQQSITDFLALCE